MTLDELKKRAEGAIARREEGYLEAQCSYAVVLKLLEMIAVLRKGHDTIKGAIYSDRNGHWMREQSRGALTRADEIERSLRE